MAWARLNGDLLRDDTSSTTGDELGEWVDLVGIAMTFKLSQGSLGSLEGTKLKGRLRHDLDNVEAIA